VRAELNLTETPRGPARVEVTRPERAATAMLALGHGAGGDVTAPDLQAVRHAALAAGLTVVMITQPYRVAGRRAPAPAGHLDEAWTAVVGSLPRDLPLVVGGRSSGARVACRTAVTLGAVGVLTLAFPLHPPGRPERSRLAELPVELPTLVLNGDRDPFGIPPARPGTEVVTLLGETHDLKKDPAAVAAAAVSWLRRHHWAR
jgi:uncharacterized protein